MGSAVAGSAELMAEARRVRRAMGGGMRQVGILAAAALYALANNVERLASDHASAKMLAERIAGLPGVTLDPAEVETNIVVFGVCRELGGAPGLVEKLKERGVLLSMFGPERARCVVHLGVSRDQVARAGDIMAEAIAAAARS
jgi:threonine aldolase